MPAPRQLRHVAELSQPPLQNIGTPPATRQASLQSINTPRADSVAVQSIGALPSSSKHHPTSRENPTT